MPCSSVDALEDFVRARGQQRFSQLAADARGIGHRTFGAIAHKLLAIWRDDHSLDG